MANHPQFEEIREEIEAKQRTVLFEDGLRASRNVSESLWKGDSNAKPIQRAGLVVFGLMSFLPAIFAFVAFEEKHSEGGSIFGFLFGLCLMMISIRLFRNAILRSPKHQVKKED
jgi:hypothetical protein